MYSRGFYRFVDSRRQFPVMSCITMTTYTHHALHFDNRTIVLRDLSLELPSMTVIPLWQVTCHSSSSSVSRYTQ